MRSRILRAWRSRASPLRAFAVRQGHRGLRVGAAPKSKYFADVFQEQAWTFIKAKEWQKAYRALDLLLLASPETPDAPELRLTMGNLNLRMSNFFLASDAFGKVRDEFEPVYRQLQQVLVKAQADPSYFDALIGKSLELRFGIAARSCRRRPRAGCAPSRTSRA